MTLPGAQAAPSGETVRIAAEEVTGGQARKTLKLKGPSLSGAPAIALEGAGAVAAKAAAAEKSAAPDGSADLFSFALTALTLLTLAALTVILAMQAKTFSLFTS